MGISGIVRGQCTFSTRLYANSNPSAVNAGLLTSVDNASNAADGIPSTFSVLNRSIGVGSLITVTQFLSFSTTIAAGTPVTVKLGIPSSLVSLLGGVSIQPFTGLHNDLSTGFTWQATAVGDAITNTSLLGLINGAGDMEITFTPKSSSTGNVAYGGVWVTLSGVAVGQSLNLYDAYVMQSSPTQADCGTAVDVLAGTRAALGLSIANATGGVDNPTNAIDNSTSTYAQLNVGAQVLSEAYLTTIFNTPSQPGDVVRMILQNVSGGVVNLGLISNFTIQLYNGSTAVGSPIQSSSSNLTLTALTGTSVSDQYQLDIKSLPTDAAFDRVDVQIGGVTAVGTALRIYDVKRLPATPIVTMNGTTTSSQTVCQGSTSTLAVSNPQASCTTYSWYNTATGGTALTTGTSYTPPAGGLSTGTNTYYVQANRTGCTEVSDRIPVAINVNPLPTFSSSSTPRVCKGTVTANMPYTATNAPTTYSIVWDATALAAGFVNVTNATLPAGAITVAVPAGAAVGTYNGTLTVKNGTTTCGSASVPFSVIVDGKPTQPVLTVAN
jgi:hypothetical protein